MARAKETVLAVDPGKNLAGVALFKDGILSAATLIRAKEPYLVAEGVYEFFTEEAVADPGMSMDVDRLVTEGQQIYQRSQADPNDMLPLAQVVGGVHALLLAKDRFIPMPREWKGTLPKEVFSQRILSRLTTEELGVLDAVQAPKSLMHNVVDGVGLGLWVLGRMDKKKAEWELV